MTTQLYGLMIREQAALEVRPSRFMHHIAHAIADLSPSCDCVVRQRQTRVRIRPQQIHLASGNSLVIIWGHVQGVKLLHTIANFLVYRRVSKRVVDEGSRPDDGGVVTATVPRPAALVLRDKLRGTCTCRHLGSSQVHLMSTSMVRSACGGSVW